MNAKAATCPSEQLLTDYGLGKLDNAESDTIHEHLETCSECRIIADCAGDSFVIRLREANAQPALADAPGTPAQAAGTLAAGELIASAIHSPETPLPASEQPASNRLSGPPGAPPELVNHSDYELLKELGRGGMGTVYLARNRMMDRLEVLKVVSKSLLERPGAIERFQQEIRSAARLAHANIVAAYSVLRPGDLLVFAMEYIEGQDLSQVVKQRGPLPVTNATFYAQQVALGLQHAHDKGMVHRDIKPNNLMLAVVGKKHVVKILDFGLAKATSEKAVDAGLTKSGQILGTPDYIAPEQTLDSQKADIRSDIYSLGCTLYYLLAGHTPFRGNSLYEILQAHHRSEAPPLNLERPEVPAELAAIVAKMMAKDPAKRFQTPMEVAKALNPFFKAGAAAAKLDALLPPDVSITPQSAAPAAAAAPAEPIAQPVPLIAQPIRLATAQPVSIAPSPQNLLAGIETTASRPKTKARAKRRRVGRPVAIGLLLAGMLGLGAVMFKFRTADGVVAIEVNEPNAEVFVDGNRATVTWEAGGKQAEISLPAGSRKIELKKDGFKATGETVALASRGRRVLIARLVPLSNGGRESSTAAAPALAVAPFDARQAKDHQAAWASYLGVPVEQTNSIGMKLVLIPPGEFMMGSTPEQIAGCRKSLEAQGSTSWENDRACNNSTPSHRVVLTQPLAIGATEVTIGQFRTFVDATKYVTEGEQFGGGDSTRTLENDPAKKFVHWRQPGYAITDQHPVNELTWNDCIRFCNWFAVHEKLTPCYHLDARDGWLLDPAANGYRLPTEAEWECACRAGTAAAHSCGDDWKAISEHGWFATNSDGSPQSVGSKCPNAFGLFDMHGNLKEWCNDWYELRYYDHSPAINPTGPPSGEGRSVRSGAWVWRAMMGSAGRHGASPFTRDRYNGFRVVRMVTPHGGPAATAIAPTPSTRDDSRAPHELLHAYRQRIKAAWPGREDRLRIDVQNHLKLDLHDCPEVRDLAPLAGMRLRWLSLIKCKEVGDLTPLRGMPLAYLNLSGCCDVTSLEAVKGMPLEELFFLGVSDLRPLAGLPLRTLHVVDMNSGVSDLTPLSGAQLTSLAFHDCTRLADISPLKGMPLTELVLRNCGVRDLTPLKGMKLTRLDLTYERVSDLTPLVGMPLTWLDLDGPPHSVQVRDLSPLRALPLSTCRLGGCELVKDFTPVAGLSLTELHLPPTARNEDLRLFKDMALKRLELANCVHLTDLAPTAKMQLERLHVGGCVRLSDLSALAGKKLKSLFIYGTAVADLTPLRGMELDEIRLTPAKISTGLEILRGMPSLRMIGIGDNDVTERFTAVEFWRRYDAGELGKPAPAKPVTNINDPAFQAWMKTVQALPAEKQIEPISKKLMELNPGFDGKVTGAGFDGKSTPKIEKGVVTDLGFFADNVTDISPVRALVGLKRLLCFGSAGGKGKLSDLSPLQGMSLTHLDCNWTQVSDLSPLKGMSLTWLGLFGCKQVSDLTPLEGMPLTHLVVGGCVHVQNLTPLRGMKLDLLSLQGTEVRELTLLQGIPLTSLSLWGCGEIRDLTPLEGLKLASLNIGRCDHVRDLTPLKGMPLTQLQCDSNEISDLSPLQGMGLTQLVLTPKNITKGMDVIRQMKSLKTIAVGYGKQGPLPPDEFWKRYDAGEFGRPITNVNDPAFQAWMKTVAALPAEQQIEAVSKKLMELNPGFDGKVDQGIENRAVVELKFSTDEVVDLCPVRALAGLRRLFIRAARGKSKLADLTALQGMKLTSLVADGCNAWDLSPLKDMPLTSLALVWCEQVSDLRPLSGMPLTNLNLNGCGQVQDLMPLRGMKLNHLLLGGNQVRDLATLKGMPLTELNFIGSCDVRDLTPLKGMPLTFLSVGGRELRDLTPLRELKLARLRLYNCQQLRDLTPLQGLPLTSLDLCVGCEQVQDLTPLQAMTLTELFFTPKNITQGIAGIRRMQSLKTIGNSQDPKQRFPAAEFWKRYDAGEFTSKQPMASVQVTPPVAVATSRTLQPKVPVKSVVRQPNRPWNTPAFRHWMETVAALPAEQQVEAVSKRLQELNPGFDGKVASRIVGGVVTELRLVADNVIDISPVRVLAGLTLLFCQGSNFGQGRLSDLSPLEGMRLERLNFSCMQVGDLSPLKGMPLTFLCLWDCKQVPDLTLLQGMPLTQLEIGYCRQVQDLTPLRGMPLTNLHCAATRVSDLSPLAGMNLVYLACYSTPVSDLSPLAGMNLRDLRLTVTNITKGLEVVRQMKSLESLGFGNVKKFPAAEFWQRYDAAAPPAIAPQATAPPPAAAAGRFVPLFNGRDLTGWKTHRDNRTVWLVANGVLLGKGSDENGHLFSDRDDYANFHFRVEARINDGGNSGQCFRTGFFGLGQLRGRGYEASIDSTSPQQTKTGSLMHFGDTTVVKATLVPAGQWFTQEVIADGPHIVIKVNGKTTVDFTDAARTYTRGHLALQAYGAATLVEFRKVEIKELPAAGTPAIAKSDPIAERLDKAKATYQDKLERLKDGLLKSLDKKEAAARAIGDKAGLEKIQQERTDLAASGAVPTVVPAGDYTRQLRAAHAQLESAYGVAIKVYTKAKQDDLAAAADRELAEFRRHVPHPADAKEFAGKFYKEFDQKISWHEAQAACVEMGGHLPIVKNAEENAFLVQIKASRAVWLGATDEAVKGEWKWVDGSRVTYTNWDAKQPNPNLGEHYLAMSNDGRWADRYDRVDEFQPGFICQWD